MADSLRKAGHDVTYVTCGSIYTDCIAMGLLGLTPESSPEQKAKACRTCQRVKAGLREGFALPGFDLKEKLLPDDFAKARELANSRREMLDLYNLEKDGVAVGNVAAFEFFTKKKISDLNVTGADLEQFREIIVNVLVTLALAQRILKEVNPDCVVVYSAEYSFNGVWAALCRIQNKKLFSIQSGTNVSNRLSRIYANRDSYFFGIQTILKGWSKNREFKVTRDEAKEVANHFIALFESFSVFAYSSAKSKDPFSIRKHFGIPESAKVCVAALSSKDEMFAAQMISQISAFESAEMPFPNQENWVDSLIEYFRGKPDKFLLIRIHPREFPNKRDTVKSQNYERLQAQLVNLPPNVKVNWPTDNISLYDIMEETDSFLTGWTNAGKEMSFFGIPVVTYCPSKIYYPQEFTFAAESRDDFFQALEKSLEKPFDPRKTVMMFRWLSWELIRATIWIGDGFQWDERKKRGFLFRAINKISRGFLLFVDTYFRAKARPARLEHASELEKFFISDLQSPALQWQATNTSESEELAAIKQEMGRVYFSLYGSNDLGLETSKNSLRFRLHSWLNS